MPTLDKLFWHECRELKFLKKIEEIIQSYPKKWAESTEQMTSDKLKLCRRELGESVLKIDEEEGWQGCYELRNVWNKKQKKIEFVFRLVKISVDSINERKNDFKNVRMFQSNHFFLIICLYVFLPYLFIYVIY